MKKLFAILLLFFIGLKLCSQTDTIIINNQKFITIKQTEKNEYFDNKKDTLLKFYRIENGKAKYLLKHYTYRFIADCNNEFTDIGTYEIKNDSLIFTTEYTQKTGLDPIPEKQIQIYTIDATGKMIKVSDKVLQRSGEWKDANNDNYNK